jgi:hypothetical protein
MNNKELFEIALKYVEKGYSYEDLKWGDDLYSATIEEIETCTEYYYDIQKQGTTWAYNYLETL